jgi:16S rRNA G966 N2-methylase RsmD
MELARRIRPITKERAIESYQELKQYDCTQSLSLTREGTKALDYFFFNHRLAAKTKRHISFLNILKNSPEYKYLKQKTRKIKKYSQLTRRKTPDEQLRNQYGVFQLYYGTVNQFRPTVAKTVYCLLQPTVGILDFSAGWGGRCIAAMSLGIPYIGFDANKKLESSYKQMVKQLEPDANVQLNFQPSETADFSKYNYDLIFTSPPYFTLEKYEGMPSYESDNAFLSVFFIPVVQHAWNHLKSGGHMALNMPKDMYDSIKKCLPKVTKILKMPLMDRHAEEAVLGSNLKKGPTQQYEPIYIWKKVGKTKINCL